MGLIDRYLDIAKTCSRGVGQFNKKRKRLGVISVLKDDVKLVEYTIPGYLF